MNMIVKLALFTAVIYAARANSISQLQANIGLAGNDANTCLATLFQGSCQRDIKASQQENYYCCVLWDELDCFKAHYKTDCTAADAAALDKVWGDIQLTISGKIYSEPSCTQDGYGVDVSRAVCKV